MHPLHFIFLYITRCRNNEQRRVGMEYHLMGQSGVEQAGKNVAPSRRHGQQINFFLLNESFQLVQQVIFLLYQRTGYFISLVMLFEITLHARETHIVPHIFLRLNMYEMHLEPESGKRAA